MTRPILAAVSAALILIITVAVPNAAFASDKIVKLPAGSLNGSSGNCSENATLATLESGQRKFEMALGDRLAFPAKRGDDWQITCSADGLTIMSGTGCFFDGYIVAGFERGGVAISCYEGEIPKRLK